MSGKKPFKILIIDDNASIHDDFIKILIRNNGDSEQDAVLYRLDCQLFGEGFKDLVLPEFEIDTSLQGQEGFEKVSRAVKNGEPYALAFVDIRMPPGWDGVETIRHIWQQDRNIQIVICTAYSDYTWEETINQLGINDSLLILKKPFDHIAVQQLACALTKKWQLMQESKMHTESLELNVRKRTESLNMSLSRMRATIESTVDGVLVMDSDFVVTDCNKKFLEMWNINESFITGRDGDSLVNFICSQLLDAENLKNDMTNLNCHTGEIIKGSIKCHDNRVIEYYSQSYAIDNKVKGRVWSFRDMTVRVTFERKLEYQASHDALTGLPNRSLLKAEILKYIGDCDRDKTSFAVLFLDLDRFKLINDSFSHQAGDEVLKEIASRLMPILHGEGMLARLGGDEFVMILRNVNNDQYLIHVCQSIIAAMNMPLTVLDQELVVTTSIGVSRYPGDGENADELLKNADCAMYLSKEYGANQFQFYTPEMNIKLNESLQNEAALRRAIIQNEFALLFQPQFDITTNCIISVEALIRWNHPVKGMLLPRYFMPLAEETGLIVPIGEWVLRTACMQAKAWQNAGLPLIRMAVNVAMKQFRQYDFVSVIKNVLQEVGLDPVYLEIELTENMRIDAAEIVNMITDLSSLGIQIALDDFGTGYSNLRYLRELPVNRIKIDQSYVHNFESHQEDNAIIQGIITMANNLKMDVMAEGVETEEQLQFLKDHKCGEVQGFYFSEPVTAHEMEVVLREGKFSKFKDTTE